MTPWTYRLLRPPARALIHIFFRRIEVREAERVPARGPVLFAANHPNMLMDPLLLGTVQPRALSFLAKATLFRSALLGRALSACGVLPVYRRKDSPGEMKKNELTFEACFQSLQRGEAICIFPEGVSHPREAVLSLKTGCARIALEGEARNDFELKVKILPAGLYYTERAIFRSDALVVFGEPIDPRVHAATYRENPQTAVRNLTRQLEQRLRELTLHVPHEEDEPLVASLRQLFAAEPGAVEQRLDADRTLIQAVEYFRHREPARYKKLRREILSYTRLLGSLGLQHDQLVRRYRIASVIRYLAPRTALAALGFPLFLFGAINNFIPYKLPLWLSRLLTRDIVEVATIKFLSGLVSFPLFYLGQTWLVARFLGPLAAWIYLGLLPVTGSMALAYLEALEDFAEEIRVFFLQVTRRDFMGKLRTRRERILHELELCRQQYESAGG
jgi:glycerol-3-phosphate O-acyltransferase/dihydroxyacetone phosphate acyltransferase